VQAAPRTEHLLPLGERTFRVRCPVRPVAHEPQAGALRPEFPDRGHLLRGGRRVRAEGPDLRRGFRPHRSARLPRVFFEIRLRHGNSHGHAHPQESSAAANSRRLSADSTALSGRDVRSRTGAGCQRSGPPERTAAAGRTGPSDIGFFFWFCASSNAAGDRLFRNTAAHRRPRAATLRSPSCAAFAVVRGERSDVREEHQRPASGCYFIHQPCSAEGRPCKLPAGPASHRTFRRSPAWSPPPGARPGSPSMPRPGSEPSRSASQAPQPWDDVPARPPRSSGVRLDTSGAVRLAFERPDGAGDGPRRAWAARRHTGRGAAGP